MRKLPREKPYEFAEALARGIDPELGRARPGAKPNPDEMAIARSDWTLLIPSSSAEPLRQAAQRLAGYLKTHMRCEVALETPATLAGSVDRRAGIVADACHRINPEIEVLLWEYNFRATADQAAFKQFVIEQTPANCIPFITFENGQSITLDGETGYLKDYAIRRVGPSEVTAAQIQEAHQRGFRDVDSKADTWASWQFGTTPYLLFPEQSHARDKALLEHGITVTLESWTYGFNRISSPNSGPGTAGATPPTTSHSCGRWRAETWAPAPGKNPTRLETFQRGVPSQPGQRAHLRRQQRRGQSALFRRATAPGAHLSSLLLLPPEMELPVEHQSTLAVRAALLRRRPHPMGLHPLS